MIIAAYSGVGKTTAAKMYSETVVDFVCMPYKYILEPLPEGVDGESCKANPDNVMREDWPWNYVAAITAALPSEKTLLIPADLNVLMILRYKKIPYTLCYPERGARETYRRRFIDRGNTDEFTQIFIGEWDQRIAALEQDEYANHIVLKENQFLSDVLNDAVKRGIKVISAAPLADMKLLVTFDNQVRKLFDIRQIISENPEYAALEDKDLFSSVRVDPGGYGVSWTPELDLSEGELWENGVSAENDMMDISRRLMIKNKEAYEVLAKDLNHES